MPSPTCSKCGEPKVRGGTGYWWCRPCNAASGDAWRRKRYAEISAFIAETKSVPCADCGGSFPPFVMDFDHRDPSVKKFNISEWPKGSWKVERVAIEIEKCDVVCANCHRIRTHTKYEYSQAS